MSKQTITLSLPIPQETQVRINALQIMVEGPARDKLSDSISYEFFGLAGDAYDDGYSCYMEGDPFAELLYLNTADSYTKLAVKYQTPQQARDVAQDAARRVDKLFASWMNEYNSLPW